MAQLLPHELTGPRDSDVLAIFLHGWPDTLRLWDKVIDGVDKNTLRLNISYPNYSQKEKAAWGIDFLPLIERIKYTIDHVDGDKKRKKILIGHDWGAYLSFLFDKNYPKYVNELVILDVTPWVQIKTITAVLYIITYQLTNIITWFLPAFLGNFIMHKMLKTIIRYPLDVNETHTGMNYLYFYLWKNMISSIFNKRNALTYGYKEPNVPVTYFFGLGKPFHFHSDRFLQWLEKSGNEKHGVKGGHWIMVNHAPQLIDVINRRILGLPRL